MSMTWERAPPMTATERMHNRTVKLTQMRTPVRTLARGEIHSEGETHERPAAVRRLGAAFA
jgi:hypothetical protein